MKVYKTTYQPTENISREKLANPFSNETIKERLIKSKAIDMDNNHDWIDFNNGYSKIIIKDNKKLLK